MDQSDLDLELEAFGVSTTEPTQETKPHSNFDEIEEEVVVIRSIIRERLNNLLSVPNSSIYARIYSLINLFCCVGYILSFVIETEPKYIDEDYLGFFIVNTIFVGFFTIDWIARLLCCAKLKNFFLDIANICDVIAVVPYWVEIGLTGRQGGTNVNWIRIFYLFKLPRIVVLVRTDSMIIAKNVLIYSFASLMMFIMTVIITMIIAATFVFYAEQSYSHFDHADNTWYYNDGTRLAGSKCFFQSVPHALWWSFITITTTGYGDTFPISPLGKLVGGFTIVFGYFTTLFPLGFLGGYFLKAFMDSESERKRQKSKAENEKESFVEAMRPVKDQLLHIQQLLNKLESVVSDGSNLHSKAKSLSKAVYLFDTNFTDALTDFSDDEDDDDVM